MNQDHTSDKMIRIALLLLVGFLPLIVKGALVYEYSPSIGIEPIGPGPKGEFFSYYKFNFLVFISLLVTIAFIVKLKADKYRLESAYYTKPVLLLLAGLLLSISFADLKYVSLFGLYNSYEGTIAFVLYVLLFYITANTFFPERFYAYFIYSTIPFTLFNLFLSTYSIRGKNILEVPFFSNLISSDSVGIDASSLFVTTLANPNYLSGYSGVLFFLYLTAIFYFKSTIQKGLAFILTLLTYCNVLFSLSSSGFFTIMILFPILLIGIVLVKKNRVKSLVWSLVVLISLIPILLFAVQMDARVWYNTIGVFKIANPFIQQPSASALFLPHLSVYADENTKAVFYPELPERYQISELSGRTYIWNETAHLILKQPITGYGIDTLVYNFPQYHSSKYNPYGSYMKTIVDKAHNLYLEIFYGSGLLSFVGFIGLIFVQLWKSFKWLKSSFNVNSNWLAVFSILFVILAYLLQGIVNDSMIGYAPVFWILLGLQASTVKSNTSSDIK